MATRSTHDYIGSIQLDVDPYAATNTDGHLLQVRLSPLVHDSSHSSSPYVIVIVVVIVHISIFITVGRSRRQRRRVARHVMHNERLHSRSKRELLISRACFLFLLGTSRWCSATIRSTLRASFHVKQRQLTDRTREQTRLYLFIQCSVSFASRRMPLRMLQRRGRCRLHEMLQRSRRAYRLTQKNREISFPNRDQNARPKTQSKSAHKSAPARCTRRSCK